MAEKSVTTENGWALYAHPFFVERLTKLTERVLALIDQDPEGFHHHPDFTLYECVMDQVRHRIPANPNHKDFRLGSTLGDSYQHWFRAKKGMPQRYRLFFRFRSAAPKTIIYVWFNDERTIRKDGDKNDVYAVFRGMLKARKIPDSIEELLKKCSDFGKLGELTGTEEE